MDRERPILPETLGRLDEDLASASGTAGERKATGVFYTPRSEVELMGRLALVEYLNTHLGKHDREALYAVVFAARPEKKQQADAWLDAGTWKEIRRLLREVRVVDPACGAGAFLLGVMQVLEGLLLRAANRLGLEETPFERRQRIIEKSLYGADVQERAVEAARQRLRLALRVDTGPAGPAPHLHFNIHVGDTLASFDWEQAFPEVFEGETRGFDLVIGNPPYVRQEQIADPASAPEEAARAKKKAYKRCLARATHQAFPDFFGYDAARDTAKKTVDGKSDLYVYFYFLGLRLLHPTGTLCFLTSNTWLDVGYGRVLRDFLLQRTPLRMIVGHQEQRSFTEAEVNTVIALLSAPEAGVDGVRDYTARFVTLKVPFEEALDADLWRDVSARTERASTEAYRTFPIAQERLSRRDGKWGGEYLRAPAVYWTILEKAGDRLTRLDEIADVCYGIKTGANAFFYLTDEDVRKWEIEAQYLRPVVKGPRECRQLRISRKDLNHCLFFCPESREALMETAALEYIRWGEGEGYSENASVRGRRRWWHAPCVTGNAVFVKEAHDTAAVFHNPGRLPVDCRLYVANLPLTVLLFLNSIYAALFFEVYSRAGLGGGARSLMVADYRRVPCYHEVHEEAEALLEAMADVAPRKVTSRESNEEWSLVDRLFGRSLGLSEREQQEAVQAAEELSRRRLAKAIW